MTALAPPLKALGIRRLVLCGVTTEVCVHSTLRDAVDRGFECITVGDATAASQAELQAAALAMIGVEGGIFGQVWDTGRCVRAMEAGQPVVS
jgi:nicotinamidase-related amidase